MTSYRISVMDLYRTFPAVLRAPPRDSSIIDAEPINRWSIASRVFSATEFRRTYSLYDTVNMHCVVTEQYLSLPLRGISVLLPCH